MITITDQFGRNSTYSLIIDNPILIKVQLLDEDEEDACCYPVGAVLSDLEGALWESGVDSMDDFREHPELQEWLAAAVMVQAALRMGARVRYAKGITQQSTIDYLDTLISTFLTALNHNANYGIPQTI